VIFPALKHFLDDEMDDSEEEPDLSGDEMEDDDGLNNGVEDSWSKGRRNDDEGT